jgi:hypothetical protein
LAADNIRDRTKYRILIKMQYLYDYDVIAFDATLIVHDSDLLPSGNARYPVRGQSGYRDKDESQHREHGGRGMAVSDSRMCRTACRHPPKSMDSARNSGSRNPSSGVLFAEAQSNYLTSADTKAGAAAVLRGADLFGKDGNPIPIKIVHLNDCPHRAIRCWF